MDNKFYLFLLACFFFAHHPNIIRVDQAAQPTNDAAHDEDKVTGSDVDDARRSGHEAAASPSAAAAVPPAVFRAVWDDNNK